MSPDVGGGGVCPYVTSNSAQLLASCIAGAILADLRLPDGFFPRTEAVTKLQSEPSGNRETSPPPPARPQCCVNAPLDLGAQGPAALSVKRALVVAVPAVAAP